MKELLRVTCKGAASEEAAQLEDGAVDQSVSVSEDKRGRRLQRAIRVDLRLVAGYTEKANCRATRGQSKYYEGERK